MTFDICCVPRRVIFWFSLWFELRLWKTSCLNRIISIQIYFSLNITRCPIIRCNSKSVYHKNSHCSVVALKVIVNHTRINSRFIDSSHYNFRFIDNIDFSHPVIVFLVNSLAWLYTSTFNHLDLHGSQLANSHDM